MESKETKVDEKAADEKSIYKAIMTEMSQTAKPQTYQGLMGGGYGYGAHGTCPTCGRCRCCSGNGWRIPPVYC